MDRTTYKDKAAIQNLGQFVTVKQNTDKEGRKTAMKYNVSALPTLMVMDSTGKVILRVEGGLLPKDLALFLKDAKKKAAKKK